MKYNNLILSREFKLPIGRRTHLNKESKTNNCDERKLGKGVCTRVQREKERQTVNST